MRRRTILGVLALPGAASAQARQLHIVNPFPPGSPVDLVARLAGDKLEAAFGQPVVVESRSGAGGTIGAGFVARAAADGSTLLCTTASLLTAALIQRDLPYQPLRDLVPIWGVQAGGLAVVVNPGVPARTLAEFTALARAQPGRLSFASSGHGSVQHFGGALYQARAGVQLTHVPYRGGAPAATDLIAGHVDAMFDAFSNQWANIQAGRVRVLALLRDRRLGLAPDIPTAAEAGLPGAVMPSWIGLFAPAATAAAALERIEHVLRQAMAQPDAADKLLRAGQEPDFIAGAAFRQRIVEDAGIFARIAREAGIGPE